MSLHKHLKEEIVSLTQRLAPKKQTKLVTPDLLKQDTLAYVDINQVKLFDKAIRILDEADLMRRNGRG